MNFNRTCFFILWITLSQAYFTACAQTDTAFLSQATSRLEKQPVTEKVYLHLDKTNYNFGDTIWYKAYTVIGQHHQLSGLSGVLYVELINPKDSLVTRQILPLVSGVGWSDIPLAHSLKQGIYRIRAYTRWMRNFNNGFYEARVRIGGVAPAGNNTVPVSGKPDLQFFPEGGGLVEGIRSRVAFKAVGPNGLSMAVKGTVVDNDGNTVAGFATEHAGMGEFALTPAAGKTYTARVGGAGETSLTFELPIVQKAGYCLAVNNSQPDSIFIKVAVNEKALSEQKNAPFYIIAQSSDKVYYTSKGKLDGLVYVAKTDKARFPSGIAQFTLFNQNGEPLAERIAFIQNADTLKLNMAGTAPAYTTRQAVKINLEAKDNSNQPVTGSFSVAVINESETGTDINNESTILNNLLLTSDLKGYIEQPNYYFNNANDKTRADLDLLMLTQGYRRFEWKKILMDTSFKVVYQAGHSLELSGMLKTKSGKPAPDGRVILVSPKQNIVRDTTTDNNGIFTFAGLAIADTQKVVLRAHAKGKGDDVNIYIKEPAYAKINKDEYAPADTALNAESMPVLQKHYDDYKQEQKIDIARNNHLLKEVTIKSYATKKYDLSNSSNIHGGGNADQVIMGKDLNGCITLSQCLSSKVFGVIFEPSSEGGMHYLPFSTREFGKLHGKFMTVIIDGTVTDAKSFQMDDLNVNDVYSVEVLRSGASLSVYGSEASGGALIITTRRGGEHDYDIAAPDYKGIITYRFTGYTPKRVFYSPKYNTETKTAIDERTGIYWNPNIITDKDGKATFEYFNNDTKGTYRVVVEGIDDNGNLGRLVYRYKVE